MGSRISLGCKIWLIPWLLFLGSACQPAQPFSPSLTQTIQPTQSIVSQIPPSSTPTLSLPSTIHPLPPSPEVPKVIPTPTYLPAAGPILAFLREGDIWLVDEPGSEPYPLTVAGDILGFAWTPNGERLVAYNGSSLCFFQRDGSVRTACLDLGLNETQAAIPRRLVISPDQRWVVLWNSQNPQDPGVIGWMIVALDSSNIMYRIEDPVDWGATFGEGIIPGGFTGQPLFLSDGRLIGTLSHTALCSSSRCSYQLFEFELDTHIFTKINFNADNEPIFGREISLAKGGISVGNIQVEDQDCGQYRSIVTVVDLQPISINFYPLERRSVTDINFSANSDLAVFSSVVGCTDASPPPWQIECGLDPNYEILPLQIWKPQGEVENDLYPGVAPRFSPDSSWIAFTSCMRLDQEGSWQPDGSTPPSIYILHQKKNILLNVMEGDYYEWQP